MADRRADETPLAPRRSLSGPSHAADSNGDTAKRPLSERVSSAVAAAGSAVQSATSSSSSSRSSSTGSTRGRSGGSEQRTSTGIAPASKSSATRNGASARPRGTRKARLRLVHLDPWSVMKTSFLLSIAFGIVTVVAVFVVWSVLGAAGVWDSINQTVSDVLGGDSAQKFDVTRVTSGGPAVTATSGPIAQTVRALP